MVDSSPVRGAWEDPAATKYNSQDKLWSLTGMKAQSHTAILVLIISVVLLGLKELMAVGMVPD